ncbi:hypothetical protein KC19_8G155400, partial [Ceratodon purpureus]
VIFFIIKSNSCLQLRRLTLSVSKHKNFSSNVKVRHLVRCRTINNTKASKSLPTTSLVMSPPIRTLPRKMHVVTSSKHRLQDLDPTQYQHEYKTIRNDSSDSNSTNYVFIKNCLEVKFHVWIQEITDKKPQSW